MSVWSDMSTIVTATLSGDINFKVVQAYRSDAAWFVFGPLTVVGAVLMALATYWTLHTLKDGLQFLTLRLRPGK